MSIISKSLLASSALMLMSSMPAFSQSLAKETIEEYFSEIRAFGAEIAVGGTSVDGDTAKWHDIVISLPKNLGKIIFPTLAAQEIGDGQVKIIYPEITSMTFKADETSPLISGSMTTGVFSHIISGPADTRLHVYSADKVDIIVSSEDDSFSMVMSQNDLTGSATHTGTDIRHFSGTSDTGKITTTYSLTDSNGTMKSDATYNGMKIAYDIDSVSEETIDELLNGKRNMALSYSMASGSSVTSMDQEELMGTFDIKMGAGIFDMSIKDGIAKMIGSGVDLDYGVKLANMPLPPFNFTVDSYEMDVTAPLKKTDEITQARYMIDMDGLVLSDTIWGMFDPTGSLPRDKAKLTIDLSAGMKWLVDLQDIDKAEGTPAEVETVTINDITLEIAGAKLHGVGAAKLDNSKFPPEPKLVALGLVPQEQGQMVKMFSGMFTLPGGDGDDHLTSKIEMKEGGSILVNGQQVK